MEHDHVDDHACEFQQSVPYKYMIDLVVKLPNAFLNMNAPVYPKKHTVISGCLRFHREYNSLETLQSDMLKNCGMSTGCHLAVICMEKKLCDNKVLIDFVNGMQFNSANLQIPCIAF